MRDVTGDLWSHLPTHAVVVPTNIGWAAGGRNPMGRGVAAEAARRFPALPFWYGTVCRAHGAETSVVDWTPDMTAADAPVLILFPTKPLDPLAPYRSWYGRATLELVERSARQLGERYSSWQVALPLVGCGEGGLREEDVLPLLHTWLRGDNFVLVRQG